MLQNGSHSSALLLTAKVYPKRQDSKHFLSIVGQFVLHLVHYCQLYVVVLVFHLFLPLLRYDWTARRAHECQEQSHRCAQSAFAG